MPVVGMNSFQTRPHYLNHFMLAKTNKVGQRSPHAFLIVCNQDAHTASDLRMRAGGVQIRSSNAFADVM
jgi:hypothetical protein